MTKKRIVLIVALVIAIALVLVGILHFGTAIYNSYTPSKTKQEELKTNANLLVEDMFNAIESQDDAKLEGFMNVDQLQVPSADIYNLNPNEILKYISTDIAFKIKETTFVSSSQIDVFGTVTAPDLGAVWGQARRNSVKNILANSEQLTKEEINELVKNSISGEFNAALADATKHMAYNDVTIHYVRNGFKWEIQLDEELENAIFGGLYKAINTTEINKE